MVCSLDDTGERHTKSDKGEGGVSPYGVIGVGIDDTGVGREEEIVPSVGDSKIRLPSSCKSHDKST